MPSIVGNSAYAASLPFTAQGGAWYDGKNIMVGFYDGDGVVNNPIQVSVADAGDMVFTQQDITGDNIASYNRGYKFNFFFGYRATYAMLIHTDGSTLNGLYVDDNDQIVRQYPLEGLGFGVSALGVITSSVTIDRNDRIWVAGNNNTHLQIQRGTNPYNLTPLDGVVTVRATSGSGCMPQWISYEDGRVGLLSAMNTDLTLYYDEWDGDGNRTVTDEVVTTDISSWAYTRGVATRDNQLFVMWRSSSTPSDLKYRVRSAGTGGTWGTVGAARADIDGTAGNFQTTADYGKDGEVVIFYYDGTDINHFRWTGGSTFTSNTQFVAAPTLINTLFSAPYFESHKIPFVYHLSNGDIMCETLDLTPTEVYSGDGNLLSTAGHNYQATAGTDIQSFTKGTISLHMFMGRDNIPKVIFEDDGTFNAPVEWGHRYWDFHNTITGTIDNDGYVYTATGGRTGTSTNTLIIKKSNYPLDHASFEADLVYSNWVDISPSPGMIGRGYKGLLADRNGVLYLIFGENVTDYTVREYRSAAWSAKTIIVSTTYDPNHTYFGGFALDDDAGQESIHLTVTYHKDDATPGIPGGTILQDAMWYINILPDGDGTFTIRESDKTTIIAAPANESTMELIDTDTANHYWAVGGGMGVLSDGSPIFAAGRRSSSDPYATESIGVWTVSAGVWSYQELQNSNFPHYYPPRIVVGGNGIFVTTGKVVSDIVEIISFISLDDGASWGNVRNETSGSLFDNYYAVPSPRNATSNNLLFHSRLSRNYSELIFATLILEFTPGSSQASKLHISIGIRI